MSRRQGVAALAAVAWLLAPPASAAFLGHGGPVTGIAVSADGEWMVSTSFDYSAIVWRLDDGAAAAVLHGHDAAVNDVVMLGPAGFATAGDDGRILVWQIGAAEPVARLEGHQGRVVDLDVSRDGDRLASAGWDHAVQLWTLAPTPAGAAVAAAPLARLPVPGGAVNAVRFVDDGSRLVTAGADGVLRLWRTADGTLLGEWDGDGAAVNALAVTADGLLVYAASAAGEVRRLDLAAGRELAPWRSALPSPLVDLALSADGKRLAVTGMDGSIPVFATATGEVEATLGGERSPLWSLAMTVDGLTLLAGGNDRTIRQWSLATGRERDVPAPLPAATDGGAPTDPGAAVWRRCVACHTLEPDGGNRAGPTLHGIFGRRMGTVAGYPYSPALRDGDLVWTEATVAELFRLGPDVVTPGTKMPVQRITDEAALAALIEFLGRAAMPAR